eukprot:1161741-Pelagomonas_calceolata.AAC.10
MQCTKTPLDQWGININTWKASYKAYNSSTPGQWGPTPTPCQAPELMRAPVAPPDGMCHQRRCRNAACMHPPEETSEAHPVINNGVGALHCTLAITSSNNKADVPWKQH